MISGLIDLAPQPIRLSQIAHRAAQAGRASRIVDDCPTLPKAPRSHDVWIEMAKTRERKLRLNAPLVADKLMPFVDDNEGQRRERLPRPLLR